MLCPSWFFLNIQVLLPPLFLKMSASPPIVILSDEEDARIHEHEVVLEKAKHVKEERQRQREEEAQKVVEAEQACKEVEAEKAWRDVEAEEA